MQLRQLFSFCGKIQDMRYVGASKDTAAVEYATGLVRLQHNFVKLANGQAMNQVKHRVLPSDYQSFGNSK